jgi:hypothetical protein
MISAQGAGDRYRIQAVGVNDAGYRFPAGITDPGYSRLRPNEYPR